MPLADHSTPGPLADHDSLPSPQSHGLGPPRLGRQPGQEEVEASLGQKEKSECPSVGPVRTQRRPEPRTYLSRTPAAQKAVPSPIFPENVVKRKISTHLDFLGIPRLGGKNVKTFRWDHRLQMQNLFMAFKRVPLCCLKKKQHAPRPFEHPPVREEKCQNV